MSTQLKVAAMAFAVILLAGCGNAGNKKTASVAEDSVQTAMVGNDKDEHGCIASAGYTWSEVKKDCIRLWEQGVRMHGVDDTKQDMFLVFSPDSAQVELFFAEEGMPNEILDRRKLPAGGYVWNVEDDDTKNVRLENGAWTVSQRGILIYSQTE